MLRCCYVVWAFKNHGRREDRCSSQRPARDNPTGSVAQPPQAYSPMPLDILPGVMKAQACLATLLLITPLAIAQTESGESMYKASCAQCHDAGVNRAPQRDAFKSMSPERVLAAMETGEMISMGMRWPFEGRRAIAEYVTGKAFGTAPSLILLHRRCVLREPPISKPR